MKVLYFTFILASLLVGQVFGLFTSENVIFQKTNEVFINDAHWSVTFVHDLRPFRRLMSKINSDLGHTDEIIRVITNFYQRSNLTGYVETFESLHVEIDMLTDTYTSIYDSFGEYKDLSLSNQRYKRSLIPIIGQLMSTLFGTVSESDLENIDRNIKALADNQEQIIHDLDVSLSVLNLTRMQVVENRRSIMDLIIVIQKLDDKIREIGRTFEQKLMRLEQFVHTYLQFQMIIDEIRLSTQDAIFYLESLKSELNMLSMHHLSTSTISPKDLKKLLIEVESKLLNNFELPRNPRKDIWYFYKTLTCVTYLQNNEIRIVLKIPLISTKEEYEVYQIHNLPIPFLSSNQIDVLVKYAIETEMIMISKDKTKFSLLSESTFQICNSYHFQFCDPETAFYQTNMNKFCIIALFMQNARDIKTLCKQVIVLNEKLPATKYLSHGVWIVITNKPLTFTVNCQSHEPRQGNIKITPPFGIIQLNITCKASNDYLRLPEYFGKSSHFQRSDPLHALLKIHNITQFTIWNDTKTQIKEFKALKLPSHLVGMKEIPMQSFLRETKAYKSVSVVNTRNNSNWTLVAVSIVASILFLVIIVWLVIRKSKSFYNQIIGKRWTTTRDLEGVNVEQTPTKGEKIEMSVLQTEGNVNNAFEGQRDAFRRTDAAMAWSQNGDGSIGAMK